MGCVRVGDEMELTDRLATSEDAIARDVAGETVLLNLASGTYFGLNAVGGRIWNWLDQHDCSLGEICARIETEFDVSSDEAQRDVLALATELVEHGLLRKA